MRTSNLFLAAFLVLSGPVVGFQQAKKPLTHDLYDSWKAIGATSISRDGKFVAYAVNPQIGDGVLYLHSNSGSADVQIARGGAQRFTRDGKFLMATIAPSKADVDKAKKEKKAPKDQPKNNLLIVDLSTGKQSVMERMKTWRLPAKDIGWFAYQNEDPISAPAKPGESTTKPPIDDELDQATQEPKKEEPKKDEAKKKKEHTVGAEWLLRNLNDGNEIKLADVADINFNENGDAVLYSVSTKTGDKDGLYWLDLKSGTTTTIAAGKGQYKMATIHDRSGAIAFLTDRDRYDKDPTEWALHLWKPKDAKSVEIATNATPGIEKGWVLLARGALRFSDSGARIILPTGPKPEPEAKPADDAEEKANLDVWSYTDKVLMPQQLLQASATRLRSYDAIFDIAKKKLVQVENETLPNVAIGNQGDASLGLSTDEDPYQLMSSWTENPSDIYVVDVSTGAKKMLLKETFNSYTLTLDGRRAIYFDRDKKQWYSMDLASGQSVCISNGVTAPLWDTEDDHPVKANPAGPAQQLRDGRIVVTDSRDLWVLDGLGKKAPVCLTDGVGRLRDWTFSMQPLADEDDEPGIDPKRPLNLRVVDQDTMATGFFRDRFDVSTPPEKLIMGDCAYTLAGNATNADTVVIRRSRFEEYSNLWVTNTNFASPTKISDANPQQKDYLWGTSELVNWISADGIPLKGVLIKPENFDPGKKYPMIVYFYERSSDTLHQHFSPAPSASTVNPTMFASNGYIVFEPDIPYTIGYPGESAEKAIISGTLEVLRRGYVDPKRIGIQGQSWGGYQVMHLITRTKLYAAAGAGAAVSNMTSAYGGIRLGSGLVRQFQYEVGQSRIGGSIWEQPLRYIENSPLFWAEKVETPVLMMNNDADDAVPFQQGVEMFTALRRLGKTAWMLNYNNDKHNLMVRANRKDLSIRLQQFFDHYLKGAPMPKWMADGVPATKKGKDYGLELKPPKP